MALPSLHQPIPDNEPFGSKPVHTESIKKFQQDGRKLLPAESPAKPPVGAQQDGNHQDSRLDGTEDHPALWKQASITPKPTFGSQEQDSTEGEEKKKEV